MRIKSIDELKNPVMRKQAQQLQQGRGKVLKYPLEIKLPIELRSKNEFTGSGARWVRAEAKKQFILALTAALGGLADTPHEFQYVTFTRVLGKGKKLWDDGNMAGGDCIQLQDASTEVGLWYDDSPKWIKVRYLQDYKERPEVGYTRINIQMEAWND